MPYPILDPRRHDVSLTGACAMAIMAKAPKPGRVKTRLSPPLTPEEAAALNTCFLRDSTANIASLAHDLNAAGVISYTPVGDEHLFEGLLPLGYQLIPQRGEGFGERLLATAEDLFACGFGSVCLIDSDSPSVPRTIYLDAVSALRGAGDRVVLGPSDDGGYYLIGLKTPHPELFENIPWSTSTVFEETALAVQRLGLELEKLPLWYDVDDGETLRVLHKELLEDTRPSFVTMQGYAAPYTRQFLEDLSQTR